MVFRDKSPVTAVGGTVAVVAHHPVIIHLESIILLFLAVDEYFPVAHGEVIRWNRVFANPNPDGKNMRDK